MVGQGPAVLAAGVEWKLFDFWGVFFFNLTGFCREMERYFFIFLYHTM